MLYTVEAIVIRSMDYGEGHKILTLFTKEGGKVGVIARGAKKMRSRLAGLTLLFTYGEFTYYRSGQMGNLSGGDIITSHQAIQDDIYKTAYAAYLLEMIDRMLLDQEGSAHLFEQLLAALEAIEENKDAQIIAHLFEMKMLSFGGYAPSLDACASCAEEAPLSAQVKFSIQLGGMLCTRCAHKDGHALVLSGRTVKLMQMFQRVDLKQLGQIQVSNESKEELRHAMRLFMNTHVSEYWKSHHFIEQMEKFDLK